MSLVYVNDYPFSPRQRLWWLVLSKIKKAQGISKEDIFLGIWGVPSNNNQIKLPEYQHSSRV